MLSRTVPAFAFLSIKHGKYRVTASYNVPEQPMDDDGTGDGIYES